MGDPILFGDMSNLQPTEELWCFEFEADPNSKRRNSREVALVGSIGRPDVVEHEIEVEMALLGVEEMKPALRLETMELSLSLDVFERFEAPCINILSKSIVEFILTESSREDVVVERGVKSTDSAG